MRSPTPRPLSSYYRLRRKAHRLAERLRTIYGSPRHDNKDDPLDELVFIILSQMTTHWSFGRVYDRLKGQFQSWEMLLTLRPASVKALIKDAGLSNQKAPRLLRILRQLKADFGKVSLDALREMSDQDAERYLRTLPGVGVKTAKCVLMYSLGREVLPVDTHVRRVASRVGLVPRGLPYTRVHEALEAAVAPPDRYTFHVNAISHGRKICLPKNPRCSVCLLRLSCAYYRGTGRAAGRRTKTGAAVVRAPEVQHLSSHGRGAGKNLVLDGGAAWQSGGRRKSALCDPGAFLYERLGSGLGSGFSGRPAGSPSSTPPSRRS